MPAPATYGFLPWLRRGISTEIARVEGDGAAGPRASIPITVEIGAGSVTHRPTVDLALHGPGEVVGIDARMVVRVDPQPNVQDAEPNYLPAIEFDQPDFPWRFTPARTGAGGRLKPWVVLAVLTDEDIEDLQAAGTDRPLDEITVRSATTLPHLSQSWAWAHVQVSGLDTPNAGTVPDIVRTQQARVLSRLLCPRRLQPRTAYTALLVPAFERGRLAGLGELDDDTIDALTSAWGPVDAPVRLPVYYRWRFQTGVVGDFEYLVRQLRARDTPADVGRRDMDVSDPGAALPAAASGPIGLEGALASPATTSTPWPAAERNPFVEALATLLNRPTTILAGGDPTRIVTPPLYGRWLTAREKLAPGERPPWFHELNADPRLRVAAGLGTAIVQTEQQSLMASAWEQVEGVLAANEALRRAQAAREILKSIRARHLETLDPDTALLVTSPLHARVQASPRTVRSALQSSPVAEGMLEGQFRRVVRPLGPVGRRQGRPAAPRETTLVSRANRGELLPSPPPRLPAGVSTPSRAGGDLVPRWASAGIRRLLGLLPWFLLSLAILLATLAIITALPVATALGAAALLAAAAGVAVRRLANRVRIAASLRDGKLSSEDIARAGPPRGFAPATAPAPGGGHLPQPAGAPVDPAVARAAVSDLRTALAHAFQDIAATPTPGRELTPTDIPLLRAKVLTELDPERTIPAGIRTRLQLPPWITWEPEDPIEPVMVHPFFDEPMYEPLRDLSQDWLLPGVETIPQDTVSLLVTNQRFIEGYMVGLNHEMARELLWREYLTDQRGTYFRQFWDVRGYLARPGETLDPETLKDVKPIHAWGSNAQLGGNSSRRPAPGGAHLVLIVRGEVLRRYPNTVVYAHKARLGPDGKRALDAEQQHPVFHARLQTDISFFGFELTASQVRGSTDPAADQGWFFVLQEQPSEPRFGLDVAEAYGRPLGAWADLSWGHLAADEGALENITYVDLNASLPDTRSVVPGPGEPTVAWHADAGLGAHAATASDVAYITLQRPFRVAVHGSDMLPPEGGA